MQETKLRENIAAQQGCVYTCYILGAIALLFYNFLATLVMLAIGISLHLAFRNKWKALKQADQARSQQIQEVVEQQKRLKDFDNELSGNFPKDQEDIRQEQASINRIAQDLKDQYLLLDIACRELGSSATSWTKLAQEIINQTSEEISSTPSSLSNEIILNIHNRKLKVQKEGVNYSFEVTLDDARFIMQVLGYKRLPKSWSKRMSEKIL